MGYLSDYRKSSGAQRFFQSLVVIGAIFLSVAPVYAGDFINVRDYGAKGDNTSDDYPFIQKAFTDATRKKVALYFPPGKYLVKSQLVFSLGANKSGLKIYGAGVSQSVINAAPVTASPQITFSCESASESVPCHSAFLTVQDIGFETDTAETGVAFGNMDLAVRDNINELKLDAWIYNHNTSPSAKAVTMNRLYNPDVRLIANVKGDGTALTLRQVSFGRFFGSFGAGVHKNSSGEFNYNHGVGIRITDKFNNGNVFLAMDIENVATFVVHDSKNNQGNTFVGGTFSFKDYGVVSTAGERLLIQNPGINPTQGAVGNIIHPKLNRGVLMFPPL
jgi:hypothetical protein